MGPDAIKDKLEQHIRLYPYIKKNYIDYYVMNKAGTDENNGLHRTKTAWNKLGGKMVGLEAIVKSQINMNKELVDKKSSKINVLKRKWVDESSKLKSTYKNNIAGRPLQNQLYDEHSNNIVETIYYSLSIIGMGFFIYKQIKEKKL